MSRFISATFCAITSGKSKHRSSEIYLTQIVEIQNTRPTAWQKLRTFPKFRAIMKHLFKKIFGMPKGFENRARFIQPIRVCFLPIETFPGCFVGNPAIPFVQRNSFRRDCFKQIFGFFISSIAPESLNL